jgi:molecular chaperone DnaJ
VSYPQLVLGDDVTVPGVSGDLSLRVPAGTQSGKVFHLKGRGLPRVNASGVGDLHVRVQLWTPDKLSAREEQLVRELATAGDPQQMPAKHHKGLWEKMKEAIGA